MGAKPLNIAMFSLHSSPIGDLGSKDTGGMSVYIRQLSHTLGQNGHRVDIFTRKTDSASEPVIPLSCNVRLVYLEIDKTEPIPKPDLYAHIPDYWQAADAFRIEHHRHYDIIHSHYWLSGCLGHLAQNRWKVPHILMFHTLGAIKNRLQLRPPEPGIRLETEKRLALLCHRILVAAEREKTFLARFYDVDLHKIGVVPCGVDMNLFRPENRSAAQQHLDFKTGERILLYVGRFDPLKQIDRLMAAVTRLLSHHNIRLVIIGGDGDSDVELQRLKKLAAEWQIQSKVTFAGRIHQRDLPPYYSLADMLVVPSAYESFGLVGLESLACGTPVVATPVGAMERIIRDGRTGRILPDDRPQSIARAIEDIFALIDRGALSAQNIRSTVRQYNWSAVAAAVLDEYETSIRLASAGNEKKAGFRELN